MVPKVYEKGSIDNNNQASDK